MKHALQVSLTYLATAAAGILVTALPAVYPLLVVLVAYSLTALTVVGLVCATSALIVLTWAWTRSRVGGWQIDQRLASDLASFGQQTHAAPSIDEAHAWDVAYEQLGYIGFSKGSLSFGAVKPYITSKKQIYWTWMKDQMMRNGYAVETKEGTRFVGSYKRYGLAIRKHEIVLAPHPELPPPTITLWIQASNMVVEANMANMR